MKIRDPGWLSKFQAGIVRIFPGDALRAKVETAVNYDFDKEVLGTDYSILEVLEVIPTDQRVATHGSQLSIRHLEA